MRCGGRDAGLLANQLRPVQMPVIGAKLLARDFALCYSLNCYADFRS